MEEILEKNIFNDRQLLKLAPDYCPADIILRMQMRRSMVKDSHCHGLKRKQCQRNNSTKHTAADNSRINTEIVRLKDTFETENTKNEINLKNSSVILSKTKIVESKRNNFNAQASLDDIQLIERKENDVKIVNKKEEIIDLQCNGTAVDPFSCYYSNLDEVTEKLREMKVDSEENVNNKSKYFNKIHNQSYINQSNNDTFKDPMDDLQSLLIKMAIASVPTDDSVDNQNTAITKDSNGCNEINSNTLEINLSSLVLESHKIRTDDNEDFLKIQSLKVNYNKRDGYLANKYLQKWRGYVTRKNLQSAEQRKAVIQNFFDKLDRKKNENNSPTDPANKAKLYAKDYSNYQHRYKVQKHIIALQKAKLEEQNRLIESLKYNKIIDISRQSVEAMKEEVRRTYFEIDRHLKPKIKCMTNELKIPEIEEPALVLHCLKVPQFLQRMEKRAREREEKHALIRERRAQMEEERVRMKQQMELAKLEMDKEEKLKRMKELKEKRKREKIENIRKKQHAERMRALIVMADLHYEKNLVNRCGLQPWKKLIEMKRDNMEKARAHYKFQLRKNVFLNWMWHTEDMWYERNFKAEDFHRKKLLKRTFNGFKHHHHHYVLLRQTAEDYYELYLVQLAFRGLRRGVQEARREMQAKWERAVQYYNSDLLFKTFSCWRTLPALMGLQRQQEARKARWRKKVLQVVPDYTPPED